MPMATAMVANAISQGSICSRSEAHDTVTTRTAFPARRDLDPGLGGLIRESTCGVSGGRRRTRTADSLLVRQVL
jgi:hypothetical protein